MQEYIKPLHDFITNEFIAAILQVIITNQDRLLYSLPVMYGGLAIPIYPKYQKYSTSI